MYIHIAGGLPGPRPAVCASEQWPSKRQAPRQGGWGLAPDAGPGTLPPLELPRGTTGQICCGGPEQRPGGAWSTQGPAVRSGQARGLICKAQGPKLGHPSVCLLNPLLSRARGGPRSGADVAWAPAHLPFWSQTPAQRKDCGGRTGSISPGLSQGRALPPLWKEEPTGL